MRSLYPILLLLALPAQLLAQAPERHGTALDAAELTPPAANLDARSAPGAALDGAAGLVPAPTPALARASAEQRSGGTRLLGSVLRVVGGAAAGAWVGYMASQVAVGDWEDQSGIDRASWAASGAAVGVALGLTIPIGRDGERRPPVPGASTPDRYLLTGEELRASRGGSLYEVIRSLRPQWLRTRGTGSIRETARGSASGTSPDNVQIEVQPGIPTIRVYLDDSLLGDVQSVRTVDVSSAGEVRFLPPAKATQRYGAGHLHGAILVITAPSG